MKIAVIGSKGMVGSAVTSSWNDPVVCSKLSPPFAEGEDELVSFDLPDFDVASRICTDGLISLQPDVILNLSSINLIDWLETHPNTARTIHVQGAANLRHAAQKTGSLLVQLGCAEIFYDETGSSAPKSEDDHPNPESIYAKTKLDAERAVSEYKRHLIIRTSSLFGFPGEQGTGNLVTSVLNATRHTSIIRVLRDVKVSPIFSLDLVRAIRFLVKSGTTGLYHIAGSETAAPVEIAGFLLERCGLRRHKIEGITLEEYGCRAPHSLNTSLDSSYYHHLSDSYHIPNWKSALREFLDLRSR